MIRPHENIDPIPDNDPDAVPELWNAGRRQMNDNFAALDDQIEEAKASISEHSTRITGIENESAGSVTQALRLDWEYSSQTQIAIELFYDSWTLLQGLANIVTDAVAGDDSLDLDTIEGLKAGEEYVVFDDTNQEQVVISELLTATRARATANLTHSYTNAKIRKTSWELPGGKAVAKDGAIYIATGINLGDEQQDKGLIIRKKDDAIIPAVYFQDVTHTTWTQVAWSWKRTTDTGEIDIEYILPAIGKLNAMIVINAAGTTVETEIYHQAFVDQPTGLGGIHNPPATPSIVLPADGAVDVDECPSIAVDAYVHPAGAAMQGVIFELATDAQFSTIIASSGVVASLSWSPEEGVLPVSTTIYVRGRAVDVYGGASGWANTISFTTADAFITVKKPTAVSPEVNEELTSPDSLTLVSSAFDTDGGTDTHANSQWRLFNDSGCTDLRYDSGVVTDLTSHVVPDGTVERGGSYFWRVKHEGTSEGWSDWSDPSGFSIADILLLTPGSSAFGGVVDDDGMGIVWDVPGIYTFTMPESIPGNVVVAVAVGGGGAGGSGATGGGSGGGLGWKNSISITPGATVTVVVGAGGDDTGTKDGGASQFGTLTANGGQSPETVSGYDTTGGTYSGADGGGQGGDNSNSGTYAWGSGGHGAGGYSGQGGEGAVNTSTPSYMPGEGGGGAGGALVAGGANGGGGGGVGLYGEGASGTSFSQGGSGGSNGKPASVNKTGNGGGYGGGGGARGSDSTAMSNWEGLGGGGAVRIMWGPAGERSFPSDAALFVW